MLGLILIISAASCVVSIEALRPFLLRYALARTNARSSHSIPTPQGGGIAVVGVTLLVAGAFVALEGIANPVIPVVALAAILLGVVGLVDDIRPLSPLPRFAAQILAVMSIVAVSDASVFPAWFSNPLATVLIAFAGLWFVNLVNFMDGLDLITVSEMVPITGLIAFAGLFDFVPVSTGIFAAALCGALVGFAPFNRPVASLFLGDVGSLPIGLLVGWMLLELAGSGAIAAAILLPLYYLMDATITLLRRLTRGEKVWEAHRSHFYQQATETGFSTLSVSIQIFTLNVILAALAAGTMVWPVLLVQTGCLASGIALTAGLLHRFKTRAVTI